jgi:hypothetical protein
MLLVAGFLASFARYSRENLNSMGEIVAAVHVNIEIDKSYLDYISLVTPKLGVTSIVNELYRPLPTRDYDAAEKNIIIHAGCENIRVHPISLCIPQQDSVEILNAIDNISVFIGNKLFYFSRADILALHSKESTEQEGFLLYELSGLHYDKSIFKNWINWYGDFNFILRLITAFLIYPDKFLISWLCLVVLLFLYKNALIKLYCSIHNRHKQLPETLLVSAIIAAGLLLRLNGYVRHSAWWDELYSATLAANPERPFLSAFMDPGNPPFYFMLLRCWFTIFGWSESAGRLLSVLIGTFSIISLYLFVRKFAGKRAACVAALLMVFSSYIIGFSHEMRGYILEVLLVPIISFRLLIYLHNARLRNMVLYIIPCMLIVNTHYYGILLVMANFLFFICYKLKTKSLRSMGTVSFFAGNMVIAISLLPYFLITALRKTVLDSGFNGWIGKPSVEFIRVAIIILLCMGLYIYFRKPIFGRIMSESHKSLFDYLVFVMAVIYEMAFAFSWYRGILMERYYIIICFPLILSVLSIVASKVIFNSSPKIAFVIGVYLMFLVLQYSYESTPGGKTYGYPGRLYYGYKEDADYVSHDAAAHPELISTLIDETEFYLSSFYYKKPVVPCYTEESEVLYAYTAPNYDEGTVIGTLQQYNLHSYHLLKIIPNEGRQVFKVYIKDRKK